MQHWPQHICPCTMASHTHLHRSAATWRQLELALGQHPPGLAVPVNSQQCCLEDVATFEQRSGAAQHVLLTAKTVDQQATSKACLVPGFDQRSRLRARLTHGVRHCHVKQPFQLPEACLIHSPARRLLSRIVLHYAAQCFSGRLRQFFTCSALMTSDSVPHLRVPSCTDNAPTACSGHCFPALA